MKDIKLYLSGLIVILLVFVSCSNKSVSNKEEIVIEDAKNVNESELLFNFINKSGDLINTKKSPSVIRAEDLIDVVDKSLIIDIRSNDYYVDGHINGAINVKAKDLIEFMGTKANPSTFEKVVLVGYTGQTSSYYTALLRFLGYGNVYSLKYGMCAWSSKIEPRKWQQNISNKYATLIETKNNPKGKNNNYPQIKTNKTKGYDILKARINEVANDGFGKALIKIDKLMEEKDKYYIINYWPVKNYNIGHIKGAIHYEPRVSMATDKFLNTLPTDKPIVIYCYVGHHSPFLVAYLRILGYDVYSLAYGANSFMYDKMKREIGHTFNAADDINDFPLVAGEKPSDKKVSVQENSSANNKPKKLIHKKKKKAGAEGGC
ncbi:MAG: hypothetical protein B6I20_03515 [Bacteroidetes bacterium 4572_117]|nr:MAG: hypothetical protein B6I20_03515 [Bacteroidetes bacterium 4572_117]